MHQKLNEIIEVKKREVSLLKKEKPDFRDVDLPAVRDFKDAISSPECISLIAEIKFASPSAGRISEVTDPVSIGKMYEGAGASAVEQISVSPRRHRHSLGVHPARADPARLTRAHCEALPL